MDTQKRAIRKFMNMKLMRAIDALDPPLFYETNPMCVCRDQEPCRRSYGGNPESPKVLSGVPSGERVDRDVAARARYCPYYS
jgi:hypothetical protein